MASAVALVCLHYFPRDCYRRALTAQTVAIRPALSHGLHTAIVNRERF
jgi:hypothetical protein